MKAVILAAGKGMRMGELTNNRPKPLIPIHGKPFLGYILDALKEAHIREIGIIVHYLKDQIITYVDTTYKGAFDVTYIEQRSMLGTGDAIAAAESFTDGSPFIVISGDNYYSLRDIQQLIQAKEDCTVCGTRSECPEKYGVLEYQGTKLRRIIEKPVHPPSNIINAGLYKFTSLIFPALKHIKPSISGEYYITDAINILAKEQNVHVMILQDSWIDLGCPADIARAEHHFHQV